MFHRCSFYFCGSSRYVSRNSCRNSNRDWLGNSSGYSSMGFLRNFSSDSSRNSSRHFSSNISYEFLLECLNLGIPQQIFEDIITLILCSRRDSSRYFAWNSLKNISRYGLGFPRSFFSGIAPWISSEKPLLMFSGISQGFLELFLQGFFKKFVLLFLQEFNQILHTPYIASGINFVIP